MIITFCAHCRKQAVEGHECDQRPADHEGPDVVEVPMNRRQRRAAIQRAKSRMKKEKGRG